MSHTTNDTEDTLLSKDQTESALTDESNCGGNANGGVVLKKGPWTSAEDAILIDYVEKHGEGNWNAVQKHSGLARCGKSCRLRWANHLRPNLKKGAFTQEEEQLIIELHAKMGNKWAHMAAHLPGRTDNEIKNYWNTRIKRHQRAGLPLYPPEFSLQAMHEIQKGPNFSGGVDDGEEGHRDLLQTNGSDIPDVIFDSLKANQCILSYVSQLPDITASNMLMKGLDSCQYDSFISPTVHCRKRLRESVSFLPGYSSIVKNEFSFFDQFPDGTCDKVSQSLGLSFPFDPDPTTDSPSIEENQDSHTISSGNFSASKPTSEAVKSELPSLQFPETDFGSWGTSAPQPLLESVDTFIQSPPTGTVQSNCPSPRNSGLLDALLHEAKNLSGKDHSAEKSSNASVVTPGYNADSSTLNICKTEWEDYGPLSPLGHTSTSLSSESTPVSASGSSLDERPSTEIFTGCHVKSEPVDDILIPGKEKETSSQLDIIRPDALLASECFEQSSAYVKDQIIMTDAFATLLGDDLSNDYKQMAAGASSSNQGWGLGSCSWNNMPAICQMSELP